MLRFASKTTLPPAGAVSGGRWSVPPDPSPSPPSFRVPPSSRGETATRPAPSIWLRVSASFSAWVFLTS